MQGPDEPCDDCEGKTRTDEPGKTAPQEEEEERRGHEDSADGPGQKGKGDEERYKELLFDGGLLDPDVPFEGEEGGAEKKAKGISERRSELK